jgi:hypothetical protein
LHVNPHVCPLQEGLAFAGGLHVTQAPPQTSVPEPQVQTPALQVWLVAHAVSSCHWPFASHFCGVLGAAALHRLSPGAHTPVQTPSRHVLFVHGCGGFQIPLEEHDSTLLPLHWTCPARQPVHAPLMQGPPHATAGPHVPLVVHVCRPVVPLHRVVPGVHGLPASLGALVSLPVSAADPVSVVTTSCQPPESLTGATGASAPASGCQLASAQPAEPGKQSTS